MLKSIPKIKILAFLLSSFLAYHIFLYIKFELKYNSSSPFFPRPLETYIQPLTLLFFLAGILQLFVSNFRKTSILKIYLQYYIITSLILLPFNIYWHFFSPDKPIEMTSMFFIILSYAFFVLKAYVLYILQKESRPLLDKQDKGETVFRPVNKWNRLLHHLFDTVFYSLAIYSTSSTYRYLLYNTDFFDHPMLASLIRASNTATGAYIMLSFFALFYYLVLEVVFNITIGKTILGNMIVNDEGARPSIAQRFGRTFCRIIPFNALSFLFSQRGWHDSITNTYVVKAEKH